nr:MAG TPA: hypothetical protein [Caudoviricetes sp.]DAP77965.1 MAG TPA: hypothetical protein [Caudoviricetes sp.]DAR34729.1 MAG TPA: hypothetical protein [Caudoviricetes sp.]DAT59932.1 MAG TPA: hypothetical protein [Caudoviricetes sp.]DAX90947.1 MAG TPA: hypothetical protein [Caudoviricetes sp.]
MSNFLCYIGKVLDGRIAHDIIDVIVPFMKA